MVAVIVHGKLWGFLHWNTPDRSTDFDSRIPMTNSEWSVLDDVWFRKVKKTWVELIFVP